MVTQDDFDANKKFSTSIQYVEHTAEYDYVYMLKNLEGNGYTEIEESRVHVYGVLGSQVTATAKEFDYAIFESADTATINQESGQKLYVYYNRKSYTLSYETDGGSYVAGGTYLYGAEAKVTNETPTREGYTFAGWYTDKNLSNSTGASVTINGDTTIYAKWTPQTVNYTIVYMFEKYNDTGTASSYVYDNSATGRGQVGTTVLATSAPAITRKGWEADTTKNRESSVVIAADGSSVLYVYYSLRPYSFTFTINGNSTNGRYRMTIKGTTYRADKNTKYSFTAKLGQDISADWPINGGSATIWDNNNGYYFYYWSCQGTGYASKILRVTDELLPNSGTNVSVTGYWRNNNSTVQVNYYLQNADNNNYTLSTLYSQLAPSGNYSPKGISGYIYDHSDNDTDWWDNVTAYNFYYNRDAYQIEYYYGDQKLKTISNVKFDATITSTTYNWTPTAAQCGVDNDYTFEGWYNNSELKGTPYVFNKMPAGATNGSVALVLYAKWTPPTYTVNFVDTLNPSTEPYSAQTIEKYGKVTHPGNLTKDGYHFDGWFTTADGDEHFDWQTQITADTTVYAQWTPTPITYTVHYVDEDGVKIADDKVVTNATYKIDDVITERAISIAGYRPAQGQ